MKYVELLDFENHFDLLKNETDYFLKNHPTDRRCIEFTKLSNSFQSTHVIDTSDAYDTTVINGVLKTIDTSHYTDLHKHTRGTIFEHIYFTLKSKFKIGTLKLVILPPKFIYKIHTDVDDHIHIPIIAKNSGCIFEQSNVFWFEEGKTYYCKSAGFQHTFFNCSETESRVHLIASVPFNRTVPLAREGKFINWEQWNLV